MSVLKQIGVMDENILLILRISISVTVQGSQDTATVISGGKVYHVGSATTGSRYMKKVFLAARNSMFVIYKICRCCSFDQSAVLFAGVW